MVDVCLTGSKSTLGVSECPRQSGGHGGGAADGVWPLGHDLATHMQHLTLAVTEWSSAFDHGYAFGKWTAHAADLPRTTTEGMACRDLGGRSQFGRTGLIGYTLMPLTGCIRLAARL